MGLDILASVLSGVAAAISVVAAVTKAIRVRNQQNGKDRANKNR